MVNCVQEEGNVCIVYGNEMCLVLQGMEVKAWQ